MREERNHKIIMRANYIFIGILILLSLAGCNAQIVDTTFKYDYAYISLPNGECVEGEVQSWTDYQDGDQLQVKFKDGTTYLTDSTRCVLVNY